MSFDSCGSTNVEGQPLAYEWDFDNDGTVDERTEGPEGATNDWTFADRGEYTAPVTVRDATTGVSDPPARLTVYPGNTPPDTPSITSPADEPNFTVPPKEGETARANITATGSATHPDGDAVALAWEVVQHHDANHTHPHANGTGETFTFPGADPEGLYSTDPQGNYLELQLIARDSLGLVSEPTSTDLRPQRVNLRLVPKPSDLKFRINGKIHISAPHQRDGDGHVWAFRFWSDGGVAAHAIDSPEGPETYTATFRRVSR